MSTLNELESHLQEIPLLNYREALVLAAKRYIGYKATSYQGPKNGKDPSNGFDCSGFVAFLLQQIGFPLPENYSLRHVNEFFDHLGIYIDFEFREAGDLVFFSYNRYVGQRPTHMGIMVDPNHYIHSPGQNNSVTLVEELNEEIIPDVPEQIYRTNPIGFKRLTLPTRRGRWQRFA